MTIGATIRTATRFNSVERRKSHYDPAFSLSQTHSFTAANNPIDTDVFFPNRQQPITFAVDIQITGNSANGAVIELGNNAQGLSVWVTGGDLFIHFGGTTLGTNGLTAQLVGVTATVRKLRVVGSAKPGNGQVRIWVNGMLDYMNQSSSVFDSEVWSAAENGAVAATAQGTSFIPGGSNIAPVDFELITPVRFFNGQVPRQF